MTAARTSTRPRLSLVGALACLVALSIALTVATPYFAQARSHYDTARASDEVAAVLGEARRLAVFSARAVGMVVDQHNRSVSIEGAVWRKMPDGIALAGPRAGSDGRALVVFHPDGSSEGGQVVVSSPGRAISLVVGRADGKVRRVEARSP